MAKRYRLNLNWLEQLLRPSFVASMVEVMTDALEFRFPDEEHFERGFLWENPRWLNSKTHSSDVQQVCRVAVLTVWKGDYRGVQLKVIPRDPALNAIDLRVRGFAPGIENRIDSLEKRFNKCFRAVGWLHGLLWPLYLLYAVLVFPSILVRVVLGLRWHSDMSTALSVLDSVWSDLRSRWHGFQTPKRIFHPAWGYLVALLLASAGMAACFVIAIWWTEDPAWEAILTVTGGLLGMTWIGCVVGCVLTLLGFESEI